MRINSSNTILHLIFNIGGAPEIFIEKRLNYCYIKIDFKIFLVVIN